MISLVMTILGQDRPGVVERLSTVVTAQEGNWLESRMAHLAGQFAGIVHVEIPADKADELVKQLTSLEGLTVIVAQDDSTSVAPPTYAPLTLDLMGNDRSGIVHEVSRVLAEHQVNVEEFNTERTIAPMSGEKLFRASAKLRLPSNLTIEKLQSSLEQIARDLMVDIRVHQD